MFADARVDGFHAILRKRATSMLSRVQASASSILRVVAARLDCPVITHAAQLHMYYDPFKKNIPVESVMRYTRELESKVRQNNYGWLKSRHLQDNHSTLDLGDLTPQILKLSPESCTSIAVKLEVLTEHITSTTLIIPILKNLLQEEDSMLAIASNVKRGKEKARVNKIHPVLGGGKASVSFIFQKEK